MASLHYALDLHLAFLLFQEDSVVVPHLGTFSVRRYGAEIQLPAGLILPPARRVSFSPDASGNPSALLNHLAQIEGLTTAEALERVAAQVSEWQRILERGDRLNLQGVGSVRRADSSWVFKASLEANFLSASYGLPMFRMDLLAPAKAFTPERVERPAPRVRSWQAAAVVAGALGLAAIGGTKDDVRGMVQSASVRTELHGWWTAQREHLKAFGLASEAWMEDVKGFLIDLAPKHHEELVPVNATPSEAPAATSPAEVAAPDAPEVAAPDAPEVASPSKPAREEVRTELAANADRDDAPDHTAGEFALVVGAFEEAGNAERLAASLRQAGYPAKVLKSNVGLKKVALRTFADANSARQAKAELKSDFPAIWIYHE